jgi:hypothetical protein
MPHHLREIRGKFQYQRAIPRHLQETVAQIEGHKSLTEKEKEKGRTVPFVAWFIRSTGTGNEVEAKRIAQEKYDHDFRRLITRAELWVDAPTIATAINEGRMDEVPMARISLLNQSQAAAVWNIVVPHLQREAQRETDINALTYRFRAALCGIPLNDNLPQTETAIAALTPRPFDHESVYHEPILEDWKNHERYDDTDPSYKAMQGRWRDFFAWLVEHRNFPQDCHDMTRITSEDLHAYKSHLIALMAKGEIKSKTVEYNLGRITRLYRHGIEQMGNKTLKAHNPVADFKNIKGKTDPKDQWQDLTRAEVQLILTKSRAAPDEIRWPNWLAAYSGGRLAEIVEAQTQDVEIFEDGVTMDDGTVIHGRTVVFHIRRLYRPGPQATLKTDEISERPVPLHDAVLAEGFEAYVARIRRDYFGGGHGPLFPQFKVWNGRLNHYASLDLMDWLRNEAGITEPKKVFHSWRHTVKTRFRGTDRDGRHWIEREDVSDKLTGHAKGTIGRTYGYFPIPDLRNAISRVPAW